MSRLHALVLIAACDAGVKPTPPPPPPAPVPAPKPVPPPAPPTQYATQMGAPAHEHVLLGSIKRGACYGTCPIYSLTVYRDGSIEYNGEEFVKKRGPAKGHVTDAQLAALDKLFIDGKYFAYKSSYESYDATDAPSAATSYRSADGKQEKTIKHYYGDMKAPASLTELESKFDEIVKIETWIGTEAERDKLDRQ